jgi:hypothetical protein
MTQKEIMIDLKMKKNPMHLIINDIQEEVHPNISQAQAFGHLKIKKEK